MSPDPKDAPEGGFLSRWSRRKAQVQSIEPAAKAGAVLPTRPVAVGSAATAPVTAPANSSHPTAHAPALVDASASPAAVSTEPAASPPTLDDVAQLDAQSDYRRFTGRDVDPSVRNAAMKKLFHSDPHFNVMDGLDVYIDDYNAVAPLPKAMLRNLLQARTLGLIDDELKEQERPEEQLPPPPEPAAVEMEALGTEGAQALAPAEPISPPAAATAGPADPETPPLPTAHPDSADPA